LGFVNYYLKHNKAVFLPEEIAELQKYQQLRRLAGFELGMFFFLLFAGKNPA
jgi:hypothetical protein